MKITDIISEKWSKIKKWSKRMQYNLSEFVLAFVPAGLGCSIIFIPWVLISSLLALWTQSNINQFLIAAEKTTECPYWLAWIPSFIFMPVTFILNIISEIVQLFL